MGITNNMDRSIMARTGRTIIITGGASGSSHWNVRCLFVAPA